MHPRPPAPAHFAIGVVKSDRGRLSQRVEDLERRRIASQCIVKTL